MNTRKTALNSLVEFESPSQSEMKPYHSPQLTEWGDLQELTRGSTGTTFDLDGFNTSGLPVRPQPVDPNFPFLKP